MVKGSDIRKVGLIAFIIAYVSACVFALLANQLKFFFSLLGCGASIGIGEGVSVWLTGYTLSTNITRAWKEKDSKAIWLSLMCWSLILTMVFLTVHFFPWEWVFG